MNLLRRYGPRGVAVLVLQGASFAGLALGTRVMTNSVDRATFGDFKLISGVAVLVVGLTSGPLTQYAMRGLHDASEFRQRARFVEEARGAILTVSILLLTAASVGLVVAALFIGSPLLIAGGSAALVLALSTSLAGAERGLLTSAGRVVASTAAGTLIAFALPFAAVAGAIVVPSHPSVAMVGSQSLALIVIALALRRLTQGEHTDLARIRAWLRTALPFAAPLAVVGGLAWLFNLGDRYLLAILASREAVGTYSAAYGLAAAPLTALGSLLPTLAYEPLFRTAASSTEERRRQVSRRFLSVQVLVVSIGVATVALLAPFAVELLLAPEFRGGAVPIIRWVALGQGCLVAAYALDLDSYSVSRTSRLAFAYVASVTVSLVLNLALVPRFGALGAAVATAISGATYLVAMLLQAGRRTRHADIVDAEGHG